MSSQKNKDADTSHYDVVIIGSGLGGLVCGLLLAKEGKKVCILEKNRQFGGALQIFSRDKCIFDTGVHYIGGLDKGQNLQKIFHYLGIYDKLKLKKMDTDAFDVISFDGDETTYPHAQGYERFKAQLKALFPDETKAIDQYCETISKVKDDYPLFELKAHRADHYTSEYENISAKDFIDSLTEDETLRNVLAGNNVLYAGKGDKSPLYIHALISHSYIQSAWKCVDGGAQIEKLISKEIKKHGGVLRNYSEVSSFEYEDKKITAARCKDGAIFYGDLFISNLHPEKTIELVDPTLFRNAYINRIKHLENTPSVFTLNVVFKKGSMPYHNSNYYHYKQKDVWNAHIYDDASWPKAYAVYFPYSSTSPEYAQTAIVLAYMNFEDVAKWQDTVNIIPDKEHFRGEEYERFKQEKADKLLKEVEKRFLNFTKHIQSCHASTPLTYRDYLGTNDGAIYGIQKNYTSPYESVISPKTRIKNLYLTGQNTNMHGVLGVTISALVTCAYLLGFDHLVNKINEANE